MLEIERGKEEAERSWVVCGLTHRSIAHVLARRALPFDVYRAIRGHYVSPKQAEWDEGEDYAESAGWHYDVRALEQEARKVATAEQLAIAERLKAEDAERRRKHDEKMAAYALLDTAPSSPLVERHYTPVGEEIQDLRNEHNVYGGGHWWVIEANRIISVRNNGADADDWRNNNIVTGGAGAIGRTIPKTEELVRALQIVRGEA